MLLSVNQPYFAPFTGFFYKAQLSDVFVILDRVQFPRGTTWLTRNRFKSAQGILRITIPVWKKGLGLQRIDEVRIFHEGHWKHKHLNSLISAYAHAPYFREHLAFVERIFSDEFKKLVDLNLAVIRRLLKHLEIDTKVLLLSDLGIDSKGNQLLIDICKKLHVRKLLAQGASRKYIDEKLIYKAGIDLQFFTPVPPIYPQLWGDFVPNLSAFDLLFNCGPKAKEILKSR